MTEIVDPTPEQTLALPMDENDSGASTVRGYLIVLLDAVWSERDGFSGKRPFGNSGWQYDLYEALGKAGFILYEWDEHGYCAAADTGRGDRLIAEAIAALAESGAGGKS